MTLIDTYILLLKTILLLIRPLWKLSVPFSLKHLMEKDRKKPIWNLFRFQEVARCWLCWETALNFFNEGGILWLNYCFSKKRRTVPKKKTFQFFTQSIQRDLTISNWSWSCRFVSRKLQDADLVEKKLRTEITKLKESVTETENDKRRELYSKNQYEDQMKFAFSELREKEATIKVMLKLNSLKVIVNFAMNTIS